MKLTYNEPELNVRKYSLPADVITTSGLGGGGTDHDNPFAQSYSVNDIFAE